MDLCSLSLSLSPALDVGEVMGECGFGFFNCSHGGCININNVCDGILDCTDGDHSDESDCCK